MKRNYFFSLLLFVVVFCLVVAVGNAFAGVGDFFGAIGDRFEEGVLVKGLSVIIGGMFFVLSIFFGAKVMKYQRMVNEGKDVAIAVYRSTRKHSPGGATITGEEFDTILKESGEFGTAVIEAVGWKR